MNKVQIMIELVTKLNIASAIYYPTDKRIMADKEYDEKYDELSALEKETGIILDNSPTQRIGDVVLDGYKKYS